MIETKVIIYLTSLAACFWVINAVAFNELVERFICAEIIVHGTMITGYGLVDEFVLLVSIIKLYLLQEDRGYHNGSALINCALSVSSFFVLGFLIAQSLHGMFVVVDARIIRYAFIYTLLVLYVYFMGRRKDELIIAESKILCSVIIYYSIYILHGIIALSSGRTQFDLQGDEWIGSTSAFIVSLFLFSAPNPNASKKTHFLYKTALVIAAVASLFYDSRLGQAAVVVCLCLYMLKSNWGSILTTTTIVTFIFIPALVYFEIDLDFIRFYVEYLINSAQIKEESDLDRKLFPLAAFDYLLDSPVSLLFGMGLYAEQVGLIPYLVERGYGHVSIVRPPTTTIILASGGVFLMFSFLMLLFTRIIKYIFIKSYTKKTTLEGVFLVIFYIFTLSAASNIDAVLCYLIIIGGGYCDVLKKE